MIAPFHEHFAKLHVFGLYESKEFDSIFKDSSSAQNELSIDT